MANSEINCSEIVFRFQVDVKSLASKEIESPEITLCNASWKIKFIKRSKHGNKSVAAVDIFLMNNLQDNAALWSCTARAVFKLITFGQKDKQIVKLLSKNEFSNKYPSHGIQSFVTWADLLDPKNQYLCDNEATFEIEIASNPLKHITPTEIQQISSKFRIEIQNVSKLGFSYSPEVVLRGIRWKILSKKQGDLLQVYLHANNEDMDVDWSWEAHLSVTLLSLKENADPFQRNMTDIFRRGVCSWGPSKFLEWSKFVDATNRYVVNDQAILLVELSVDPPKPTWEIDQTITKIKSPWSCSICFESFTGENTVATKCGHLFCGTCIKKAIENRKKCPVCNADTATNDLRSIFHF